MLKSLALCKDNYILQGTPVLIAGSLFSLQGFPCKPLYFPVRGYSVLHTKGWDLNYHENYIGTYIFFFRTTIHTKFLKLHCTVRKQ